MSSEAAIKANRTRKANELERQIADVVRRLGEMSAFDSREKQYIRMQVARFLAPFGGPVADMLGPRGDSARVLVAHGLEVISADDGSFFKGFDRGLLRIAQERMADGWEFYDGDVTDILGRCETAFLDACGPLYVTGPSAQLVHSVVSHRLSAFALTVMLARVEGVGGGGEKSADHYIALARSVLEVAAPMYRVHRVLPYKGEASVPFAVFLMVRAACSVEDCERRVHGRGLCSLHYHAQPEQRAKKNARIVPKRQPMPYAALSPESQKKKVQHSQNYWAKHPERRRELRRIDYARNKEAILAKQKAKYQATKPPLLTKEERSERAKAGAALRNQRRQEKKAAVSGTTAKAVNN